MIKYEKKTIKIEVSLKKKIEFVCDFIKTKPIFFNSNIPSATPLCYNRENKKLIINLLTKDIIIRMFQMYFEVKKLTFLLKSAKILGNSSKRGNL